ncbi:MAG TPA: magnesium/cobalt transporter CorA [Candidatus Limnocylindria bacterium]|jgi:magnesium transporter
MAHSARTCLLRRGDGQVEEVDLSHAGLLGSGGDGSVAWLDFANPTADDLDLLRDRLNLHELALEDLRKRRQRPKIDIYQQQDLLVAYEIVAGGTPRHPDFALAELHLIVGAGYVVSVHWADSPSIDGVRERWRKNPEDMATTAGGLIYELLDAVADGYFPLLDRLSERIDGLHDSIFTGGADAGSAVLRQVLAIKRELLDLRRAVAPLRDVANALLRRDVSSVDEALVPYFQDLYDHLVRVLDTIDVDREMLASALEANLSVISNNLNVIVKRLTAFTVILMIPTLIAGIYGMNFHFMPELSWPFGYAAALLLMLVASIGAYVYFRARDWF